MRPVETEHYLLDAVPGAEKLIVVIPGLSGPEARWEFRAHLAGSEASRLVYTHHRPAWEQGGIQGLLDVTEEAAGEIAALARQAGAERVYFFGVSFGGYCALLLGLLMGAERIVAMSAETRLGMPGSRSGRLLRGEVTTGPYTDLRALVRRQGAREIHLLHGERDWPDTLGAVQLLGLPGVRIHRFRGSDHRMASFLPRPARMPGLLLGVTAAVFDPCAVPGHAPTPFDPATAARLETGWQALAEREFEAAAEAFQAVVRAVPGALLGWHGLGRALSELGRPVRALQAYRAAARLDRGDPHLVLAIAQALERAGRSRQAAAWCAHGLRGAPTNAPLRRLQGLLGR